MDQLPVPAKDYKVLVRCFTFNHSKYIEDALNGFVMQQTDFPFVCLIVDDASTDGEQQIIKAFLNKECDMFKAQYYDTESAEVIIANHSTNRQCAIVVFFLKENHYSIKRTKRPYVNLWRDHCKYEALCEGDDYWIDVKKLQKQVDFLECNLDYSMCFHRAEIIKEIDIKCPLKCNDIEDREYNPNELFEEWKVPTASILMRYDVQHVVNVGIERVLNGDIRTVLNCAKMGKIRGMSDVMSAYRVHNTGVTYSKDINDIRLFRYPHHYEFIKDNYPFLDHKIVNYKIARAYLSRRKIQHSVSGYFADVYKAISCYPLIVFDKILRWLK